MRTRKAIDYKGNELKPIIVLTKGDVIDYQTTIEETIGNWIGTLDCYDDNYDNKTLIKGVEVERDRAYFVPNADYELSIRRVIKPRRNFNNE